MIGMLATSKAGHDCKEVFVIVREEEEYVYLADGKARSLAKPKRKNKKHIPRKFLRMCFLLWFDAESFCYFVGATISRPRAGNTRPYSAAERAGACSCRKTKFYDVIARSAATRQSVC